VEHQSEIQMLGASLQLAFHFPFSRVSAWSDGLGAILAILGRRDLGDGGKRGKDNQTGGKNSTSEDFRNQS